MRTKNPRVEAVIGKEGFVIKVLLEDGTDVSEYFDQVEIKQEYEPPNLDEPTYRACYYTTTLHLSAVLIPENPVIETAEYEDAAQGIQAAADYSPREAAMEFGDPYV